MRNRSLPRRAFTLIELLVVIAIIAVLAAILFPVFSRAKDSGYKAAALTQARQLGLALQQYVDASDNKYLPSTNYGLPEENKNRIWPAGLFPYVKDQKIFVAPGTEGKFPESWDERGLMTIGYNSATAVDKDQGCKDDAAEKNNCLAFTTVASFDKNDNPSLIALFATTPGGPLEEGYRGYEFSPYNGTGNPEKPELSPPIIGDRDMVKELKGTDPDLMKPVWAKYGASGDDDGVTPIIFADGHAKGYSAKQIIGLETGIVWRFR